MPQERISRIDFAGDASGYRSALRRYFRKRAAADDVEDLVQEVFVNLQARRSDAAVENMQRFMFVVAAHVLARRRRRERRWRDFDDTDLASLREEASPERIFLARERLEGALKIIAGLTDRTRQVFLLHRFEEMTYQSIARQLGISVSAVEKHIMIALRALTSGVREQGQ